MKMMHNVLVTPGIRALVCECVGGRSGKIAEAENRKLFWLAASPEYDNINISLLDLINNRPGF